MTGARRTHRPDRWLSLQPLLANTQPTFKEVHVTERSCTPVPSRRALFGAAIALPVLAATPALAGSHLSHGGASPLEHLEQQRERGLAAVNASEIDVGPAELQPVWAAQHAIFDAPCDSRAAAAAKMRALLHPEIGLRCWHDLDPREEATLFQVLSFLSAEA